MNFYSQCVDLVTVLLSWCMTTICFENLTSRHIIGWSPTFRKWPQNDLMRHCTSLTNHMDRMILGVQIAIRCNLTKVLLALFCKSDTVPIFLYKSMRAFLILNLLNGLVDLVLLCLDHLFRLFQFNQLNRNRLNMRSRQSCTESNSLLD